MTEQLPQPQHTADPNLKIAPIVQLEEGAIEAAEHVPGHNLAALAKFRETLHPDHEAIDEQAARTIDTQYDTRTAGEQAMVKSVIDIGSVTAIQAGVTGRNTKRMQRLKSTFADLRDRLTLKHETGNSADTKVFSLKGRIGTKDDLRPINRLIAHNQDGSTRINEVLAEVTGASIDGKVLLCRNEMGTGLIKFDSKGIARASTGMKPAAHGGYETACLSIGQDKNGKIGMVSVEKSTNPADQFQWRIMGLGDAQMNITLHHAQEVLRSPKSEEELRITNERRKAIAHKLAKVALVAGILAPGGAIDQGLDIGSGTKSTVASAAQALHDKRWGAEDELDGIKIKDYANASELQNELNGPVDVGNERIDKVVPIVERTMQDLDDHNYQAIRQRAEQYLTAHPDALLPPNTLQAMIKNIDQATTVEELTQATEQFSMHYGKKFQINAQYELDGKDQTYDMNTLRYTTKGVVAELVRYPKELLSKAQFSEVMIGNPGIFSQGAGAVMGEYNPTGDGRITIRPVSMPIRAYGKAQEVLPLAQVDFFAGSPDLSSTVAHEVGHSLPGSSIGIPEEQWRDSLPGMANLATDILRGVGDVADVPSLYARSSIEEFRAEAFNGVLSNRRIGAAHPDEARRFLSKGNEAYIQAYIRLAEINPGLVDYFAAHNNRLMDRPQLKLGK
jgi:hypothetical protein